MGAQGALGIPPPGSPWVPCPLYPAFFLKEQKRHINIRFPGNGVRGILQGDLKGLSAETRRDWAGETVCLCQGYRGTQGRPKGHQGAKEAQGALAPTFLAPLGYPWVGSPLGPPVSPFPFPISVKRITKQQASS